MSAASADSEGIESAIGTQLREMTKPFFGESPSTAVYHFKLMFTFDDHTYSTVFKVDKEGITNKCLEITFDSPRMISSYIRKNSPEMKCFTPILSKESLPPGISQTDILQVLISKLKFLYLNKPTISLVDIARLTNPATGKPYKTLLSEWRILRDEPTLYEKYGYKSAYFNLFRIKIHSIHWRDVKDYKTPRGQSLTAIWADSYADKIPPPSDEETIPSFMRRLTLENIEESVRRVSRFRTEHQEMDYRNMLQRAGWVVNESEFTQEKTIITFLFEALESIGVAFPSKTLWLQKDSEVWQKWNARCILQSFEPITVTGGAKRTRRRRHGRKHTYKKL